MTKAQDLTIEQLLGIASQEGEAISNLMEDRTNVKKFIREYGVKEGACLVPNYKVYYDYCKNWNPQGNKLSKIGFLRKFSIVFNSKRTKSTRYYLLNPEVFNIEKEFIDEARKYDERYRKRVAKKRKQKKQSKISSVGETV